MGVPFSQMPSDLINDPDMTMSAVRAWHLIYVETLGRPGWDLSYGQIANGIGVSRRQTAMDAVSLLLRKGWLIKISQADKPNLYGICREPYVPWNAEGGVRSSAQGGAFQRTRGGTPERTRGGALNRTHQENQPGELQPEEPTTSAPSGHGGGTMAVFGSLDDNAEMPEGGDRRKKPSGPPVEGTNPWAVYEFDRAMAKANAARGYNKTILHTVFKGLREEGYSNHEIVLMAQTFFLKDGQNVRAKSKELDVAVMFRAKIHQLKEQTEPTIRSMRSGEKTNEERNREMQEDLLSRMRSER